MLACRRKIELEQDLKMPQAVYGMTVLCQNTMSWYEPRTTLEGSRRGFQRQMLMDENIHGEQKDSRRSPGTPNVPVLVTAAGSDDHKLGHCWKEAFRTGEASCHS